MLVLRNTKHFRPQGAACAHPGQAGGGFAPRHCRCWAQGVLRGSELSRGWDLPTGPVSLDVSSEPQRLKPSPAPCCLLQGDPPCTVGFAVASHPRVGDVSPFPSSLLREGCLACAQRGSMAAQRLPGVVPAAPRELRLPRPRFTPGSAALWATQGCSWCQAAAGKGLSLLVYASSGP